MAHEIILPGHLKCLPCTCTFLSLKTELLIFHAVAEPWNSGKFAKSREIHKNTQNTGKFGRNLIKYASVQHIWNLSQLLGLFIFRKLANLSWNFVSETCKQRPETTRRRWTMLALAMMLKALPLVHFCNLLLMKEQMMTSARSALISAKLINF